MKIKSQTVILLILFGLLFSSQQAQVEFRAALMNSPIGYLSTSVDSGTFRGVLKVVGATTYKHVCVNSGSFPDLNNAANYAADECTFYFNSFGFTYQVPYVISATSLVKIAMHAFINNVKKAEYYDVITAFSTPYIFLDLTSSVACKFILKDITANNGEWRLARAADDPFSANLPVLQKDTPYDLGADQIVYLRIPKTGDTNQRQTTKPTIHTLQESKCQTICPYDAVVNTWMGTTTIKNYGLQPGTKDRCQCQQSTVYDWETASCVDCTQSENTQKLGCKNLDQFPLTILQTLNQDFQ